MSDYRIRGAIAEVAGDNEYLDYGTSLFHGEMAYREEDEIVEIALPADEVERAEYAMDFLGDPC
jgi:hypothetical protein